MKLLSTFLVLQILDQLFDSGRSLIRHHIDVVMSRVHVSIESFEQVLQEWNECLWLGPELVLEFPELNVKWSGADFVVRLIGGHSV